MKLLSTAYRYIKPRVNAQQPQRRFYRDDAFNNRFLEGLNNSDAEFSWIAEAQKPTEVVIPNEHQQQFLESLMQEPAHFYTDIENPLGNTGNYGYNSNWEKKMKKALAKHMTLVPPHHIRSQFVAALSHMYEQEVPLYGTLLEHAEKINSEATGRHSTSREDMVTEHHGAIRVGTPEEMRGISRLFGVMNMFPVNYYNLTVAGVPVHSTAFRPVTEEEFSHNGFRVFVSLLRHDLIPEELRPQALEILSKRKIFTPSLMDMVRVSEEQGGLEEAQAELFLQEALKTFKRHKEASVPLSLYEKLLKANSLLADVVSFQTPHINHLTPEVKSKKSERGLVEGEAGIDRLQRELNDSGIETISVVQGPPKRKVPILLRQGSFVALKEQFLFPDGKGGFEEGIHRARFGEYETKGDAALTPTGRKLYDRLLAEVMEETSDKKPNYTQVLESKFTAFPDDPETMRQQGLMYVQYRPTKEGLAQKGKLGDMSMDELIAKGFVTYDWVPYEDFLPVSAAGIFKSNLKDGGTVETKRTEDRVQDLETALGQPILDSFAMYAAQEAKSELATFTELGVSISSAKKESLKRVIEADPAKAKQQDKSTSIGK